MRFSAFLCFLLLVSFVHAETPNVILISIDAVRADQLGVYGYGKNTTPNIDAFARDAVLFRNGFAASTWTPTSHASMVTGVNPLTHGIITINNSDIVTCMLRDSQATLAGILNGQGYSTAAFVNWYYVSIGADKDFGAFDIVFNDEVDGPISIYERLEHVDKQHDGFEVNRRGLEWLEANGDRKFFLMLHYFDAHDPYDHPEYLGRFFNDSEYAGMFDGVDEIDPRISGPKIRNDEDLEALVGYYDAGIYYQDLILGELFAELKEMGLYENTLIVLVSDHGEALSEHGNFQHHNEPYEEEIRVPFIIRYPELGVVEIREPVTHVDIAPTVLEVLGVKSSTEFDGVSLVPLIERDEGAIGKFMERGIQLAGGGGCECLVTQAVRTVNTKVMYWLNVTGRDITGSQVFAVYELASDPGEKRNLIDEIEHVESIKSTCEHWDCKMSDLELAVFGLSLLILVGIISYTVAEFVVKSVRKSR
ncbi:MAG: sulfatase [Candidatus Micrarchaeota archaeon]